MKRRRKIQTPCVATCLAALIFCLSACTTRNQALRTTAPAKTFPPASTPAGAITRPVLPAPGAQEPETRVIPTNPSCKRIVFSLYNPGSLVNLYSTCPDGSGLTPLSEGAGNNGGSAWDPAGAQIAFVSDRSGKNQVYRMAMGSGQPTQLTFEQQNDSPVWLPGGQKIAFRTTDGQGLWWWRILDMDSGTITEFSQPSYDFFFQRPAWSPDGSRLALMSLEEQRKRNDGSSQIHVRPVNGGNESALTNDTWANILPAWSPDGRLIAFLSERDGNYNQYALYTMETDGANLRRLTAPDYSETTSFSWSGDSRQIAIGSLETGQIEILDLATGNLRPLLENEPDRTTGQPAWQP